MYFSATGGIDLAFPIGNNFAIGPYLSAGYDWCDETIIGNFGALAIVGENNNIKFMIGQGANFQPEWECWGTSTRIVVNKHFSYTSISDTRPCVSTRDSVKK